MGLVGIPDIYIYIYIYIYILISNGLWELHLSTDHMWTLYIYIFYASRLVFGDDGKYIYNTRLAWLIGTMYETPR